MKHFLIFLMVLSFSLGGFSQKKGDAPTNPIKENNTDSTKSVQLKADEKSLKADNAAKKNTPPCCCEEEKSVCPEMDDAVVAKTIAIDFRSKNIASAKVMRSIKKGDYVRLKIMNYNPYLYKLVLDNRDSSAPVPTDGKLLGWFLDPGNIATIAASLLGNAIAPPLQTPITDKLTEMAQAKTSFTIRADLMDTLNLVDPQPKKNPAKIKPELPTTEDSLNFVNQRMKEQDVLINDNEKAFFELKKSIDDKQYNLMRKYAVLRKLYPDCDAFKQILTAEETTALESDMDELADFIREGIAVTKNELDYYQIILAPYKKFISSKPELEEHDKLIKEFYKELKGKLAAAGEIVSRKNLAEVIAQLETMAIHNSCYTSFPLYVGDDMKKIDIEMKPRFDSLALPAYSTSLTLPTLQQRVWGISSGVFFTGLHNDAYNSKPFEKANTSGGKDTLYNLIDEKPGKLQMGINALLYTGWKLNDENDKEVYGGLAFGAGLSIESKPKPRVFLGGSLILGYKNRIIISAGVTGGQVSVLSKAYDVPGEYKKLPENYLRDIFKASGFLSLNYSLFGK